MKVPIEKLIELAELYRFKFAAYEQEKLELIEKGYKEIDVVVEDERE